MKFGHWFPSAIIGVKTFNEIEFFEKSILDSRQKLGLAIHKSTEFSTFSPEVNILAKEYFIKWNSFAKRCEVSKQTIKTSRVPTFVWENIQSSHFGKIYESAKNFSIESRVMRLETIMIITCYGQSLLNQAIELCLLNSNGSIGIFLEAFNIFYTHGRDQIQNWTLRNESELPFECTLEGNEFYCLVCLYFIQKSEMVDSLAIFNHPSDMEGCEEIDSHFGAENSTKLNDLVNYGINAIKILASLIWVLKCNTRTSTLKSRFYTCIPKELEKQLLREFNFLSAVVYYSYGKTKEDNEYPTFKKYTDHCYKQFMVPLESEKGSLIKSLVTIIKKEKSKADHWENAFGLSENSEKHEGFSNLEDQQEIDPMDFIKITNRGIDSKKIQDFQFVIKS